MMVERPVRFTFQCCRARRPRGHGLPCYRVTAASNLKLQAFLRTCKSNHLKIFMAPISRGQSLGRENPSAAVIAVARHVRPLRNKPFQLCLISKIGLSPESFQAQPTEKYGVCRLMWFGADQPCLMLRKKGKACRRNGKNQELCQSGHFDLKGNHLTQVLQTLRNGSRCSMIIVEVNKLTVKVTVDVEFSQRVRGNAPLSATCRDCYLLHDKWPKQRAHFPQEAGSNWKQEPIVTYTHSRITNESREYREGDRLCNAPVSESA
jgi:hypothetical protein